MYKRNILNRAVALIFATATISLSTLSAKQPNLVLIIADDLGYGDVSYQGGDLPTPSIDSIAANGIRFSDGYVTAPVCAPSRAGLMSGRYQQRFGFWDNIGPFRRSADIEPGIPTSVPILSERLKELGYVTGLFGKTHGGDAEEMMAFNRWDEFYGFNNGASNYIGDMNRTHNPIFHNKKIVSDSYQDRGIDRQTVQRNGVLLRDREKYLTDELVDYAIRFIEDNKEQPFLCYIPFNAPHGPYQAPEDLFAKYPDEPDHSRRLVKAMVDSMDTNIGRVLDTLRQHDLVENTIVVFLSDNGGHADSPSLPLRGKKATYWEGGLRVPFCMQWPGTLPAGETFSEPISSLDIMPTFIAAAGGRVEASWGLDGVNLLPYLVGNITAAPHSELYWVWGPRKAIRSGDYKAISNNNGKTFELYNLSTDLDETTNLARKNPEKLKSMLDRLDQWEAQLPPPGWGWNPKLGYKDPNFAKPTPYHDTNYTIK